jgi:tetratricopeptide (TPR) repeat protein
LSGKIAAVNEFIIASTARVKVNKALKRKIFLLCALLKLNSTNFSFSDMCRQTDCPFSRLLSIFIMVDQLDVLFTKGEELMKQSQWEQAEGIFNTILDISPSHTEALNVLSRCVEERNPGSTRILQLLKHAYNEDPTDSFTLTNLGRYYFRRGAFKQALKNFKNAFKYDATNVTAAFNIGVCLDSLGEFSASVDAYSTVLDIDPFHRKAMNNRGIALDRLGRSEEAKKMFKDALKLGDDARTYNNLGICMKKLGDLKGALQNYKKACELDPNYSLAHYNVAVQLSEIGELEQAIEEFKKVKELDPDNAFAVIGIANTLELKGALEDALALYEEVARAVPGITGLIEKIKALKKKLQENSKIESLTFVKEQTEITYWEWDEATCRAKLKLNPDDKYALLQLGIICLGKKEYNEAKTCLMKVVDLDESFEKAAVHMAIGELFFKQYKEYDEAREHFIVAKESGGSEVECLIWIGRCYEKEKNFTEAIAYYKKAGQLAPNYALAFLRLGWASVRNNDKELGLEALQRALELDPHNTEILTKLGEILVKEGKHLEKAISLLEEAVRNDPCNPDALVAWGRCLEKLGRTEDAVAKYESALLLPITHMNAYYYLALIYEKQKDFKKSIQLLKQCLGLDKAHFGATLHLATLLANAGEASKAKKYFNHALKLEPENPAVHFGLGKLIHASTDNIDQAEAHFRRVLEKEPNHYKALCQLGIIYLEKDEIEKAAEYLKQSLAINPKFVTALVYMGNTLFEAGNYNSAVKYHQQALKENPNEVQAMIGYGNALYEMGNPSDAIEKYRQALSIDNNMADIHYNLGNALYLKEDIQSALYHYQQAINLNPSKPEAHYNLGNCYCILTDYTSAVSAYSQSIKLDPKNSAAYYNLGNALYMKNLYDDAISAFREAIRLNPDSAEFHFNIATVYQEKGEIDKATIHFKESVSYDPCNSQAYYSLGAIYESKGEIQQARKSYEKALEHKPDLINAQNRLINLPVT